LQKEEVGKAEKEKMGGGGLRFLARCARSERQGEGGGLRFLARCARSERQGEGFGLSFRAQRGIPNHTAPPDKYPSWVASYYYGQ